MAYCDPHWFIGLKIGILTYHRLPNRGSVLQAYALHKRLTAELGGAQVEVIDYSSRKLELLPAWRFVRNRFPVPFDFQELAEVRRMRRFVRQHLRLSRARLRSDSTSRAMEWLARLDYDAVVVGSDVVWEVQPRSYSIGGVTPYHLPGRVPFLKCSAAVSMDPVVRYPSELRPKLSSMADHVAQFDFISVRDEATRGVLLEHGVPADRIRYLPDPTLLVDLSELVGQPLLQRGDRPVMAVDLPLRLAGGAHRVGRRLGFEVWDWRHFGGQDVDRRLPLHLEIGQVLALYGQVDVLVTDRFHGAILASRIGDAGVVFVEHARKWPLANSKGRDLFRRAGVEASVRRAEDPTLDPGTLAEDIERARDRAAALRDGLSRIGAEEGEETMAALRAILQSRPS